MKSETSLRHKIRRLFESPIILLRLFRPVIGLWRIISIRWSARIHGGSVVIGKNVKVDHPTLFQGRGKLVIQDDTWLGFGLAGAKNIPIILQPREVGAEIVLGKNCAIMNGCEILARKSIYIGENTRIGPHTLIYDSDFHEIHPMRRGQPGKTEAVVIKENVWVGSRVIILKGVTIGRDAVVAAGCVVAKDVPAGSIVAGNPMRVIGNVHRTEE
jgi:carbonic anhydrase/acetyltransferase-like protein (isoleucine patch superfamily)